MIPAVAYIVFSELVYLWQHYGIVSFSVTFAFFSALVTLLIRQDIKREKKRERRGTYALSKLPASQPISRH